MQNNDKQIKINTAISTPPLRLISLISQEFGICRKASGKPKEDLRLGKAMSNLGNIE